MSRQIFAGQDCLLMFKRKAYKDCDSNFLFPWLAWRDFEMILCLTFGVRFSWTLWQNMYICIDGHHSGLQEVWSCFGVPFLLIRVLDKVWRGHITQKYIFDNSCNLSAWSVQVQNIFILLELTFQFSCSCILSRDSSNIWSALLRLRTTLGNSPGNMRRSWQHQVMEKQVFCNERYRKNILA